MSVEDAPMSIQARMASLRLSQIQQAHQIYPSPVSPSPTNATFSQSVNRSTTKVPPPPPPRPKPGPRGKTVTLPVKEPLESATETADYNQPLSDENEVAHRSKPMLPPRLPPRRTTLGNSIKEEIESSTHQAIAHKASDSWLPPPLPSNNHIRSSSPSASSVFSNSSVETLDTSVGDVSPKLPPRVPSRNNLTARNSWSQKPSPPLIRRSLPPVDDTLPEIKAWKQPAETGSRRPSYGNKRKASVSSIGSTETDRGRPEMSSRVSSGSSGVVLPPPIIKSKSPQPPKRPVSVSFGSSVVIGENTVDRSIPPKSEVLPPPAHRKNILSMGFGGAKGKLPSPPKTPEPVQDDTPPPIPLATRPKLNMATKPSGARSQSDTPPVVPTNRPKVASASNGQPSTCLKCRDFSRPDQHATMFPRQNWTDVTQLAHALTSPFPSATDKARAIFTWHHHNIAYDTHAFFNKTCSGSTPASTLQSGLAVCEGYAGLFCAMALAAGLEAMVIGGHGKGYGYTPSSIVPPFKASHAWAAVKMDGGEWHVTDPCWGAGNVCSATKLFKRQFQPEYFTQTSEQFRMKHYPSNPEYQFCDKIMGWEEYFLQPEGPLLYVDFTQPDKDFSPYTIEPYCKSMQPHTKYRIRITRSCPHVGGINWVVLVQTDKNKEKKLMRDDGRGGMACEVVSGSAGSNVQLAYITNLDGKDGSQLSIQEYESKVGRCGMAWSYLANWEVI